ncbi:AAA family ATPase [Lacipirellula sp.]|uniref:AAA family ATPase n=1 Tax=Lacipirellula sp. TaxID=2691419 RepID=UPI003D0BB204
MSTFEFPDLPSQFRQLLGKCRDLYVSSGELAVRENPQQLEGSAEQFVQLMDDLHRALLVKVFVSVCQCDRRWSTQEEFLAEVLVFHLWDQWLSGDDLRDALVEMSDKAMELKWYALVRPFDQIAALRNRVGELEAFVVRLANLVARADGPIQEVEAAQIKSIQEELSRHLRPIPIDEPSEHAAADHAGPQAIEKVFDTRSQLPPLKAPAPSPDIPKLPDAPSAGSRERSAAPSTGKEKLPAAKVAAAEAQPEKTPAERLATAMAELDKLIGLAQIKEEVRTLANFLKVQAKRTEAGLPTTELTLHMVFNGNPGTGKTTVARIVGNIFGAMGILKKGHLIETDRSGMVAEYAGQTGPKSHKKIDEALDGVLFIDEAYTLIAVDSEDPYGHEAVQTLLKRMEDNRDRLVVILAGYPDEMERLLQSNPGLSSRFSRQLEFVDYTPLELSSIFGMMCDKSQYKLCAATRAKAIVGLTWLHEHRDRHFGNGRTARNLFELAIRRQANRIAEIAELTVEQLSTLDAADVEFEDCPPEALAPLADEKLRFHIECPACEHGKDVPQKFLGQKVRCPKCKQEFDAAWGEIVYASASDQSNDEAVTEKS